MRGFTIIELLVVLMVTALLATLAAPRLTDRSALQERGARDQLRTMIAHSRRVAMTQQREVCVLTTPAQVISHPVAANGPMLSWPCRERMVPQLQLSEAKSKAPQA